MHEKTPPPSGEKFCIHYLFQPRHLPHKIFRNIPRRFHAAAGIWNANQSKEGERDCEGQIKFFRYVFHFGAEDVSCTRPGRIYASISRVFCRPISINPARILLRQRSRQGTSGVTYGEIFFFVGNKCVHIGGLTRRVLGLMKTFFFFLDEFIRGPRLPWGVPRVTNPMRSRCIFSSIGTRLFFSVEFWGNGFVMNYDQLDFFFWSKQLFFFIEQLFFFTKVELIEIFCNNKG